MSGTRLAFGERAGGLHTVRRAGVFGAWIALTLFAGCGGEDGPAYTPGTSYPVKGKVILPDGKPLTSGRISFVSDRSALTYAAAIGPDGAFEVKSDAQVGAPEGSYKVRVEMDETSLPKAKRKAQAQLPYAGRYTDEDASKLTADIKPGENDLEFKLEKK